tara:strand:- start:58 stop:1047 length:990 start_codon:yes stop_codon:yes gene_type:complete
MTATDNMSKYQRARQKKISKMGLEAYRAEENQKQRERRAKRRAKDGTKPKPKRDSDPNTANANFILSKMRGTDYKAFSDVGRTLRVLQEYKLTTQKKYIHAIRLAIKDQDTEAYEQYTKIYKELSDDITKQTGDNRATATEAKNWVPWEDLKVAYKKVRSPRAKALIALYTLIDPRRRNMAVSLIVVDSKTAKKGNFNYLVVNKLFLPSRIILNNYKTSKAYGKFSLKLTGRENKPLRDIIKSHITENNIKLGWPLFPNTKGGFMKPDNMSLEFKKVFRGAVGKDITFNLVRHIRISHFLSTPKSINDKKALASGMGHSLGIQDTYKRI